VIDLESLTEVRRIPVGEYPEGIALHPDGRRVYVANWFDGTVSVIDAQRLEVIETLPGGDGSRAYGEFIAPR
jgi:YVTN family beta-propeller protein